jgi:hypothetical protein
MPARRIGVLVTRPTVIELLALPGWQTPSTPLDAWVERLTALAGPVVVTREASDASWLEVGRLRLRGYAVLAGRGRDVEAINFELSDPVPTAAMQAIRAAAEALGWEVHEDDGGEGDEDNDEHEEA